MRNNIQNSIKISVSSALGALIIFVVLTGRSFAMDANHAFTFAVAVSLSSMLVIVGAALMGAYRFLKNIGVFKGHYYY